jgi:hypothetical protein
VNGTCGGMVCKQDGAACSNNGQCCNGTCTNGICGPAGGNVGTCCTAHASVGCSVAAIQNCVCNVGDPNASPPVAPDPFCCGGQANSQWDAMCVAEVTDFGCAVCP